VRLLTTLNLKGCSMFDNARTEQIRQLAKDMISHSRDWARTGQDLARTGSHRANTFIHKRPMTATLMGLGVGYLLGKLFSKRKPATMVSAPPKASKRGRSKRT
jgi:ElaB/YqjD/DUF883 family membrane-anchored ribosome-binding protein